MGVLTGKVALVTGGAKGMGKAIATLFAREGARVAVAARRIADAEAVARQIGEAAVAVAIDITDRAQWDAAVAAIDARWGALDILVNCAGITEQGTTEQVGEDSWRRLMSTNLDGPFNGCRAALPLLKRGGAPCSVINISSVFAQRPVPGFVGYCTSKAALTTFTKAFALECAAAGLPIRVNSVHPGGTETEMLEQALAATGLPRETAYAHFAKIHPMGRMGTVDEVAAACLWLASDASSFTTGQELNVDGGSAIRP
ncbi:SDR family NAD(P)-dependent oxidoreductase [Sphingomonas profundi]|uniref:SDR family NAD(P)-dependent oxidoreductase n=1 Tax=Alterirhizorhabdus profundi TaxID=2681549 RepID=UPI0012E97EE0|nr:glucose 1-dehydrogenase [Sphingomonas profundi]